MQIINTTGQNKTSATFELNKAIGSFLFQSDLKIDELTTETIRLKVQRSNQGTPVDILMEDIPLAQFLLASTATGACIGSNTAQSYSTECEVKLTLSGNIALFDNDIIKFELKGLKSAKSYVISGIPTFGNAHTAFTYEKKNVQKDNTLCEFDVRGFDLAVLQKTPDIVSIDFQRGKELVNYTIDEMTSLVSQHVSISQIHMDGKIQQTFENYLQMPLLGVDRITLRKDTPTAVTNLLLRNNIR